MKRIGLIVFFVVLSLSGLRADTLPPLTNGAPQTVDNYKSVTNRTETAEAVKFIRLNVAQ